MTRHGYLNCGCRLGDFADLVIEACYEHDPAHQLEPQPCASGCDRRSSEDCVKVKDEPFKCPCICHPKARDLTSEEIHEWAERVRMGRDTSEQIAREKRALGR